MRGARDSKVPITGAFWSIRSTSAIHFPGDSRLESRVVRVTDGYKVARYLLSARVKGQLWLFACAASLAASHSSADLAEATGGRPGRAVIAADWRWLHRVGQPGD